MRETFNKADGTLGPVLTWNVTDDLSVLSNQARTETSGFALTETGNTDQTISVEVADRGGSPSPGPTVFSLYARVSDIIDGAYYLDVTGNDDTLFDLHLYTSSNSPTLDVTETNVALGNGDTLTFEVTGTALTVKVNGTVIISTTSTDLTGGTQAGFGISNPDVRLDNFSWRSAPALFTPPSFGRIPTTWSIPHPGNVLQRHYRARQEGTNVYYLSDGTVTETDPDSTTVFWHFYEGSPYVKRWFEGSTADAYELTAAEADALESAGYTVV